MRCSRPGVPGTAHGPAERLGVARVGQEALGVGAELHREVRQLLDGRDLPGLGAVGQVAVGEDDDRHHVLEGDAAGLEGDPEAVAGRGGRDHRDGRLGVAAEEGLQQVGLLGLGGQAGRGTAALDVADHERQLGGDREPHGLGLERHARAGGGGEARAPA